MVVKKILFAVLILYPCLCFATDPLLTPGDLTYMGAFRVPQGGSSCSSLQYGGDALAYNSANDSLFILGFNPSGANCGLVAEIYNPIGSLASLAKCINSSGTVVSCTGYTVPPTPSTNLNNLSTATTLQSLTSVTEGNGIYIGDGGASVGGHVVMRGLLVYNGELIATTLSYSTAQSLSLMTNSTNLSTNNFLGYFGASIGGLNGGYAAGPLALVPSAYQSQLGGEVLCGMGQTGHQGVTYTSFGPSVIAVDPANFTSGNVNTLVPATALTYYGGAHSIAGTTQWDDNMISNQYTSTNDMTGGTVFPTNTRSVLFFGSHGMGTVDGYNCYDTGVSSLDLAYSDGCPAWNSSTFSGCTFANRTASTTGAVTSGTFQAGETVKQTSTNSTMTFVKTDATLGLITVRASYTGSPAADTSHTWVGQTTGAVFTPNGVNTIFNLCYDPNNSAKGTHSYPYSNYIWAYDVGDSSGNNTSGNTQESMPSTASGYVGNTDKNNLTSVRLGYLKPYEIIPYATWSFALPTAYSNGFNIWGNVLAATYDSTHSLIYVTQKDTDTSLQFPLVHVYQVGASGTGSLSTTIGGGPLTIRPGSGGPLSVIVP